MGTIAIVVPVHGALDHLRRCVESVMACTRVPYQLYIADDGSPGKEMRGYLNRLDLDIELLMSDVQRGFAGIVNWAVAQVPAGGHLCLLNSDVQATPGWLAPMAAELDKPRVGVVGARLVYPSDKVGKSGIQHAGVVRGPDGHPYHPFVGVSPDDPRVTRRRELNAVTGACMLVRRETWDQVGGLDEGFVGRGYEDVDLCWRAREAGWKVVYQPEVLLYHYEYGSGRQWLVKYHAAARARLLEKWAHLGSDEHLLEEGP